ncbi:MAG TPA: isopentenyl-diphosphate Delta-isomerase [Acidimicrobiia bacterium]|nr:isopentenyl-diphosphate Delta-isomerase [Acidimicrobiia bacterium]
MGTVQHEPARSGVTEIRVHGVGGTTPVAMLGRSDLVQVAGDDLSGFYRVAEATGWRTVEAYSWGGLTARSAARALWALLLPFSLVNIAGWMIEPVRERPNTPGRGWFGAIDQWLARFGAKISGRFKSLRRALRGFQEWLVHLLALIFTATYIQLTAYLSADLFAFQCGSNSSCRERLPLAGFLGTDLEVGRRLVIGTGPPLALLLLFLYLARNSRLSYESFKPQVGDLKPTGATPLEDASIWDRARYQKIMARLHAVASLSVLIVTFSGTMLLLEPDGWRDTAYRVGVIAATTIGVGAFFAVAWVASRRDLVTSGPPDETEEERTEREERERRIYRISNQVSTISILVAGVSFVALMVISWPVESVVEPSEVVTWFADAPQWLLIAAIAVGVLISAAQALRWLAESYLHSEQFLVVVGAIVVAVFPHLLVVVAVGLVFVVANVAASTGQGGKAIVVDLVILTSPALLGLILWPIFEEQAYIWVGILLSATTAALFWMARRPEQGFRWAGTGAVGAFAAVVLLGIFSGLIIRVAAWLSDDHTTIVYPDFYQWAVVIVTVGLVLVILALVLYGVRVWSINGSTWNEEAKQRLQRASYPAEVSKDLTGITARYRTLVETIRAVDVMITLGGVVMFAALVAWAIDIFFGDRTSRDWFPDDESTWDLLFDVSSWLALAAIVATYFAVRSAMRSEATRRKIGMVWDVASFFPRSFHPLAPPAYAARAVPEIQARATEAVNSGSSVVLAGHSQGSVIAAAVMASIPEDVRTKTALVTYGSPIGKFYRDYFPAAFPDGLVRTLAETIGPRQRAHPLFWINFYRPTDPIAAPVLRPSELQGRSLPKLSEVALAARGRSADRCDVVLEDPWETTLRPYRPLPRLRGHSSYESDPAWAAGVNTFVTLLGRARDAEELVVLVNDSGAQVGTSERISAHREGLLHRAVSVFVFDPADRLLIQQRAPAKSVFAGRWANTSCTHPRPDEGLIDAGRRSLRNELGIDTELVELNAFTYRARDPVSGLTEEEFDHVLLGMTEAQPEPNPEEVSDYEWVTVSELRLRLMDDPEGFAPWLGPALEVLVASGVIEAD